MEGRKLTADELAGAEEIAPPAARKLSADELAGAVDEHPTAPAAKPDIFERLGAGLSRIGSTVAAGAGAVATAAEHPLDTIRDPSRRREFERGLDQMVTLGYGQKLAARIGNALGDKPDVALGPETFGGPMVQNTQAADAVAAPGFRQAGNLFGMFTPGAAGAIGKGTGALVRLGTSGIKAGGYASSAGLGMVQGLGGYAAAAPATAALSADAEGNRLGVARETLADPAGLLLAGAGGAGSGLLRAAAERSPARVFDRAKENISRGEAGGKTKLTPGKRVTAKAESGDLEETMQRHPDVYKALATKAASDPGKANKVVRARLDDLQGEINPVYEAIDAGPAVPKATDLQNRLIKIHSELVKSGNTGMADVIAKFEDHIAKHYGDGDAVIDGTPLPASSLRNLRNEVGEVAFAGDPNMNPKFRADAQRKIYGAINDTIEEAGRKTPGVDFDRLKVLNKDTSTLIVVKDALADRASKAGTGGTSAGNLLFGAMMTGGGLAHGGIKGALTGIATHQAINAAKPLARGLDFRLAQRTQRLGAPNLAAPVGARAAGLEYAAKVAEGMKNGLTLQQATEAADETP